MSPADDPGVPTAARAAAPPPASRTAALAIAWFVAFTLAFFFVPQWILTGVTALPRSLRSWLSVAWVAAAFTGCAWYAWRTTGGGASRASGARGGAAAGTGAPAAAGSATGGR